MLGIHNLQPQSQDYRRAFEYFIAMELRAYLSYYRKQEPLSYWCSKQGQEVDFIIGDHTAIEVKSTSSVTSKHLNGLKVLQEENICKKYYLISFDKVNRNVDSIEIMYWRDFLLILR